jgi:hypothetical protein
MLETTPGRPDALGRGRPYGGRLSPLCSVNAVALELIGITSEN